MAPAKRPSRARVMIVIVMYLVATVLRCRERRSDTGCGWWPSLPILKQKAWIQVLVNHSKLNSVMINHMLKDLPVPVVELPPCSYPRATAAWSQHEEMMVHVKFN